MEFLTSDEIKTLTGKSRKPEQIEWLRNNGWIYITNACGTPIVGRHYCRERLCGKDAFASDALPDFGAVK